VPKSRLSVGDSHAHRDGLLAAIDTRQLAPSARIVDQDDVG